MRSLFLATFVLLCLSSGIDGIGMSLTTLIRLGDNAVTTLLTQDCTPYSVYCGATSVDSDAPTGGQPYIVYGGTSAGAMTYDASFDPSAAAHYFFSLYRPTGPFTSPNIAFVATKKDGSQRIWLQRFAHQYREVGDLGLTGYFSTQPNPLNSISTNGGVISIKTRWVSLEPGVPSLGIPPTVFWTIVDPLEGSPTKTLDLGQVCGSMVYIDDTAAPELLVGCSGIIYRIRLNPAINNSPFGELPIPVRVGVGVFTAMTYDPSSRMLYGGSSVGLGLVIEIDLQSNYFIRKILFIPGSGVRDPITSVVLDSDPTNTYPRIPVAYWSTHSGKLVKTIIYEGSEITIAEMTNTSFIGPDRPITALHIVPSTMHANRIVAMAPIIVPTNLDPELSGYACPDAAILAVPKSDCSMYGSDCQSCVVDPYCGWCYEQGICTTAKECSGSYGFATDQTEKCPVGQSTNVSMVAHTGGAPVKVYASIFLTDYLDDYQCAWSPGNLVTIPVEITSTTITCVVPNLEPYADFSSPFDRFFRRRKVTLTIKFRGSDWVSPFKMDLYNCGLLNNINCVDVPNTDCGWCSHRPTPDPRCTSWRNNVCPSTPVDNWSKTTYPTLAPTSTPAAISLGDTSITTVVLDVFNFPFDPSAAYRCRFVQNVDDLVPPVSPGTMVEMADANHASKFSCNLPNMSNLGLSRIDLNVFILAQGLGPITRSGRSALIAVNCTVETRCDGCTDPKLLGYCSWCPDTRTCEYAAQSTCRSQPTCPVINSISPRSSQLSDVHSKVVQITGQNLGEAVNCLWTERNTLVQPQAFVATATNIGATSATCLVPTSPSFTAGMFEVSLAVGSVALMDGGLFNVYECPSLPSCLRCLGPETPDCNWCATVTTSGCQNVTGSCTRSITSNATCPIIDLVVPNMVVVGNDMDIGISGSLLGAAQSDAVNLQCGVLHLDAPGSPTQFTDVTWNSSTLVTCLDVQTNTLGNSSIYLRDRSTGLDLTDRANVSVIDCGYITDCEECLKTPCVFCGGECSQTCEATLLQTVCPVVYSVQPTFSDLAGDNQVVITGSGFLEPSGSKRDALVSADQLVYTCLWGNQLTPAIQDGGTSISCKTPKDGGARSVDLTIALNDKPYLRAGTFDFFTCPTTTTDGCTTGCTGSIHCGWCATMGVCSSETACVAPNVWQPTCQVPTLSVDAASIDGGDTLTVTLSTPLPSYLPETTMTCVFGTKKVPLLFASSGANDSVTSVICQIPASPTPNGVTVPFSLFFQDFRYTQAVPFTWADCSQHKGCNRCAAQQVCGWCTIGNKCTLRSDCSANRWTKKDCPIDKLAIGLGVGFGALFLIAVAILIIFLILRARRKAGLVIVMREPDYDAIAWGNDVTLHYRLPSERYATLLNTLARQDFILQLALSLNCPATEQDSLAKGLVYVACYHQVASKMIKTTIRAEVRNCLEENTLFRSNSVASKMYKFYSRIVGIKYLYHCIARVIMELEVLGRKAQRTDPSKTKEVSLLDVSIELDNDKDVETGTSDIDADTNMLQLQLICQKIINVLIKKTLKNIPSPLREIFVEIDLSVSAKFPGSIEAIYKGLGGLFFLRFVCPAITAPHVYGLLAEPPNQATQRQLVLITKVIQSIANMQPPGKKEEYMEVMGSFIENSIPRIRQFYDHLREAANINTHDGAYAREVIVPDEVLMNGLAATQTIFVPNQEKLRSWSTSSFLGPDEQKELNKVIDECLAEDSRVPKKQSNNPPKKKKK